MLNEEKYIEPKYRGSFQIYRKLFTSDIWLKPPYFIKLWVWLIGRVNWKDVKASGKVFRRGEIFTSYPEIIEENKFKIGFRTDKISKSDVFYFLDFLRKTGRIKTAKSTRGLWIKVLKYDLFQYPYVAPMGQTEQEPRGKQAISTRQTQKLPRGKQAKTNEANERQTQKENKDNKDNNIINSSKQRRKKLPKTMNQTILSLIGYFKFLIKQKKGIAPEINYASAKDRIGDLLTREEEPYSPAQIEDVFHWYVQSEKYQKFGPSITTALSGHSLNMFQEANKNQDWQYVK